MRHSTLSNQSHRIKRTNQLERKNLSRSKSKDSLENKAFSKFYIKDVCTQAIQRPQNTQNLIFDTPNLLLSPRKQTFKFFCEKNPQRLQKKLSLKQINLSSIENRSQRTGIKQINNINKNQYEDLLIIAKEQINKCKIQNQKLKKQTMDLRCKLNMHQYEKNNNQNSLNRFKKAVKTNRLSQLENESKRQKVRIQQLSDKNEQLKRSIQNLTIIVNRVRNSNPSQNKSQQVNLMSDSGGSSMSEYLQSFHQKYYKAKQEIKKLHLELDNQKRRKQLQIQNYIKMKDAEYLQLKNKHLSLLEKFKKVKKQHNIMLIKTNKQDNMSLTIREQQKKNTFKCYQNSPFDFSLQVSEDEILF